MKTLAEIDAEIARLRIEREQTRLAMEHLSGEDRFEIEVLSRLIRQRSGWEKSPDDVWALLERRIEKLFSKSVHEAER